MDTPLFDSFVAGMKTIKVDMLDSITQMLPLVIVVVSAIMTINFAIKTFRNMTK